MLTTEYRGAWGQIELFWERCVLHSGMSLLSGSSVTPCALNLTKFHVCKELD